MILLYFCCVVSSKSFGFVSSRGFWSIFFILLLFFCFFLEAGKDMDSCVSSFSPKCSASVDSPSFRVVPTPLPLCLCFAHLFFLHYDMDMSFCGTHSIVTHL